MLNTSQVRVETSCGCTAVFGLMTTRDFARFKLCMPKGAIVDHDIAKRLGADLVFCLPRDLAGMRAVVVPVPSAGHMAVRSAICFKTPQDLRSAVGGKSMVARVR